MPQYSTYGHIRQLVEAEKKGIEKAGGSVDVFQIAETLPKEALAAMGAPGPSPDHPILDGAEGPKTLEAYDAILLGIPTRYGNFPSQWRAFWDRTGGQWATGKYHGKLAGLFVSSGTLGGGQESTAIAAMSTLAHHGFIYVPLGYPPAADKLMSLAEVHGGSPWGAGTFSAADGSRMPSTLELEIAEAQGAYFYSVAAKHFH